MSQVNNRNIQPVYNQVETKFKGPLIAGVYFKNFTEVVAYHNNPENKKFVYPYKTIWINSAANFFYLNPELIDKPGENKSWLPLKTQTEIAEWNSKTSYAKGDTVFVENKIFIARKPSTDKSPLSDSIFDSQGLDNNYWQCIAGDSETYRLAFRVPTKAEDENTYGMFRVFTTIRNPLFQVVVGDIKKDNDVIQYDKQKLAIVENSRIVEPRIEPTSEFDEARGYSYDIIFYQDNKLLETGLEGVVNIK